jgi:hypothetical protein
VQDDRSPVCIDLDCVKVELAIATMPNKTIIAAALFLFLCPIAFSQNSDESVHTRFGTVSFDDNGHLRFRGRLVQPGIDTSRTLDLTTVYNLADSDVVVVSAMDGIACPYTYFFVSVSKAGATVSKESGTCAKADDMRSDRHSVTLVMQGFLGPGEPPAQRQKAFKEKHIIVFRDGQVTDNGKPTR